MKVTGTISPVLSIRNLTKSLGGRRILNDISFDVFPGEIFGFLGPNGSGKTTTIKVILGLLSLEAGEVSICSHDIKREFEDAVRNVGGIVENPEMYKYLTGRQNLELYRRMYDDVPPERIDEVVGIVRLEERINDKISKYSLGMRQRLGIAQAILHHPKVLVLDEPTNGLDPAGIKELRDIFKTLAHDEGCAVFVSSHMLAELEQMCDRVCVIDRGAILGIMTMDEIHSQRQGDGIKYTLETSDAAAALEIVKDIVRDAEIAGDNVVFTAGRDDAARAVSAICAEGIAVYSMTKATKSLEQAFMEITAREGGVGV